MKRFNKNNGIPEPRINDELEIYDTIRLIYKENSFKNSDNDFNKVLSIKEAFNLSKEMSLDLIEINDKVNPPIVKLYDYKKYLFEQKKNQKDKKKVVNSLKEIQLSVNISQHDLEIKANKAKEFIKNGDKVKVVLTIRGRENARREQSKECFRKFIGIMGDVAVPENMPKDDGNKVIVILKRKENKK